MGIDGAYASGAAKSQIAFNENDLKQQQIDATSAKDIQTAATKQIETTMGHIEGLISVAAKGGKDPESILSNPAVQSLLGSAQGLAQRIGQDPEMLAARVKSLALLPITEPKDKNPLTEIGKLRTDLANGDITEEEFKGRVGRLTAPAHEPNAVETIRRKISSGESLTPGESKVYSDAISGSPLAKMLMGAAGGGNLTGDGKTITGVSVTPAPIAPTFATEAEVGAAIKAGKVKVGDVVTVGGKRMKINP